MSDIDRLGLAENAELLQPAGDDTSPADVCCDCNVSNLK